MLEERALHFPKESVGSVQLSETEGAFSAGIELEASGDIFVPRGAFVRVVVDEDTQDLSFLESPN